MAVDEAPQLGSGHVELFGEIGFGEFVGSTVGVELAGEALLDSDSGSDARFYAGSELRVVGVPGPGLGEHVAGDIGGRSGHHRR